MPDVYESLIYENASGVRTVLSDSAVTTNWELRGRSGFSAPDVELITQKYINGQTKIVGRIIKPRTVTMNMIVRGSSTKDRDDIFFKMIEDLIDVDGGDIGKLFVKRSDGSTVYLNCSYASGLKVKEEYKLFHRFTLEFYAEDPYFYSEDLIETVELTQSGTPITLGEDLTLNGWCLDWTTSVTGSGTIDNPYSHEADPIYKIAGFRVDLTISNGEKSLSFDDLDMEQTDVIVIDTRERYKQAYILHPDGTRTDILGNLVWNDADLSLPLAPGYNLITVASSLGAEANLEVDFTMTALSA